MVDFFVVESNNGQRSASSCTSQSANQELQSEPQKHAAQHLDRSAKPTSSSNVPMTPPSTPPRRLPSNRDHQLLATPQSASSATSSNHSSPGSSVGGYAPAETPPSTAVASPIALSPEFKSGAFQLSDAKPSYTLPETPLVPQDGVDAATSSSESIDYDSDYDSDYASRLSTSSSSLDEYELDSVNGDIRIFKKPPPLNFLGPTTFGPYQSPYTLSELHMVAWSNKSLPIEPCLQCRVKNLPCPLTFYSPANAHLGPLLDNEENGRIITKPRSRTTHPRFPACLRCVRAGEADTCVVLRRATVQEKDGVYQLLLAQTSDGTDGTSGKEAAEQGYQNFRKVMVLDTATCILPTDRDVAFPKLFAAKLRRRDELLLEATERDKRVILAPRRATGAFAWDREKVREGQRRDRVLLSGRGRKEVLRPTEEWGERFVGSRERQDDEVRKLLKMGMEDKALVEAELKRCELRRRDSGGGGKEIGLGLDLSLGMEVEG